MNFSVGKGTGFRANSVEKLASTWGQRVMAREDYVQTAAQGFCIGDFDGKQLSCVQLVVNRDLGQEGHPEFAKDHTFAGFDGFHFENDVGQPAHAAKEAVHEGPIARAAIVGDERQRFQLLEAYFSVCGGWMAGMADEHKRIVAKADGFHFGMVKGAGQTEIDVTIQNHFQNLSGIAAANANYDVRVIALVLLQNIRQEIRADGKGRGDGHCTAGNRTQFVDSLTGDSNLAQELFRM